MAATKKKSSKKPADVGTAAAATEAYEKAVANYQSALEQMHKGELQTAAQAFGDLAASLNDEPVLAERCLAHQKVCERRLAPPAAAPADNDERFYHAVVLNNQGKADDAIRLLDEAIQQSPNDPRLLYTRASSWALKGNAEAAVSDLRQAIGREPQIRFQAVNDPDFERIREEPAFIDIIEPTPTGA